MYYINYQSSEVGVPLRHRVFKEVDRFESDGYIFRRFSFMDSETPELGKVEIDVREDDFSALLRSGEVREFLIQGGRDANSRLRVRAV